MSASVTRAREEGHPPVARQARRAEYVARRLVDLPDLLRPAVEDEELLPTRDKENPAAVRKKHGPLAVVSQALIRARVEVVRDNSFRVVTDLAREEPAVGRPCVDHEGPKGRLRLRQRSRRLVGPRPGGIEDEGSYPFAVHRGEGDAGSVGSPRRHAGVVDVRHLGELASVRADLPELEAVAPFGETENPLPVRGPAWYAVEPGRSQLPEPRPVRPDDVEVALRLDPRVEDDLASVGRRIGRGPLARSGRDRNRFAQGLPRRRVEGQTLDVHRHEGGAVGDPFSVGGDARVGEETRRRRDRLWLPLRAAGALVHPDPPEIHAAAPVAREVEQAVPRPERAPVGRRAAREGYRLAAGSRDRPETHLPRTRETPHADDPSAARRPGRLNGVPDPEATKVAGFQMDHAEPTFALPVHRHELYVLRREDNLLPVWRPRGVEARVRHPPHPLAGPSHDEKAPSLPLGPERDPLAVRRERRLVVVGKRVPREVDRRLPADALQVDVLLASDV